MIDGSVAEQIHDASLALLADPGVRIEHDGTYALLVKHGAEPSHEAQVVRFPAQMVRDGLAAAPREVTLDDRRGTSTTLTATSPPCVWSCPGMNLYRDGQRTPFARADMAYMARLLDKLDSVHGVFGLAMADVEPRLRDVEGLRTIARSTSKHIRVLSFTPAGADRLVEMKQAVSRGNWFSVGFTAHGPLRWTNLALEIFQRTAGHGIPATINGEPMAGATGPVTLAGAAAVGNAEILAGLVINQLLEPGRPCIHNLGLAHVFDMRRAVVVTGGPENHVLAELAAAMGRFYGLPSASWVSTESLLPDSQAALEKMAGWLTHRRAGVSNIWGVGQLESEMTISPAQAVIDDEMIRYADRLLRGAPVTDESLAVAVSREVGIGGQFLDHDHTFEHFHTELFEPALLWRGAYEAWDADGRRSLADRAQAKADELASRPVDHGLTQDELAAIDRIADDFAAEASP